MHKTFRKKRPKDGNQLAASVVKDLTQPDYRVTHGFLARRPIQMSDTYIVGSCAGFSCFLSLHHSSGHYVSIALAAEQLSNLIASLKAFDQCGK